MKVFHEINFNLDAYIKESNKCRKKAAVYKIKQIGSNIYNCFSKRGKILLCGNGGSAADCQHFAGELVGRFTTDRSPLPAISLTSDTSIITCISNDYDYDLVFARQIIALGNRDDILLAISTSGKSKNIMEAIKAAKLKNMYTILLTGIPSGSDSYHNLVDIRYCVVSDKTSIIQEHHNMILHMICYIIDELIRKE